MAGSSLFTLIDDIASLLDDIAALTKVAAGKTTGVLGDDLALNAEQVNGVRAERELPVVWAVAKGSALNKLIIVPVALALSYWLPIVITPLLMIGGAYLCFEGFEKVFGKWLHPAQAQGASSEAKRLAETPVDVDLVELEKEKIKGAIRTDFILSGEIVVIALGSVQEAPFLTRSLAVATVAALVTVGVYAFVAAIVKMDDLGLYWVNSCERAKSRGLRLHVGRGLLWFAPRLLKALTLVGTVAMFLVGGGILVHGFPLVSHWVHGVTHVVEGLPSVGSIFGAAAPTLLSGVVGISAGGLLVGAFTLVQRLRGGAATPNEAH